ncbi:hypothetical protein J3R82DRAFT_424 [Butyriboletus roseoflavus]|nr:hypothetical protein J3R82DRAFT_424 [Butyriboletus roseoflavus]
MIEDLLLKLEGRRGSTELIAKGEELGRAETTGVDRVNGRPVIFDPSSYFGHNEAE